MEAGPNVDTITDQSIETIALHRGSPSEEDEQALESASLDELCDACRAIDFDQDFCFIPHGYSHVASLSHITASSTCKLCSFFRWMRPKDWPESFHDNLWAISAKQLFRSDNDEERTLFYILPQFCLFPPTLDQLTVYFTACRSTDRSGAIPLRNHVSFEYLKSLVSDCDGCHSATCTQFPSEISARLRVIDCQSRRINTLPTSKTPYLTLSYVWGTSTSESHGSCDTLPDHVPVTVEDAMQVTIRLGYRYLWVDRYCIPQEHSAAKDDLINRMGEIFSASSLTIIAACGEDSESGLAGISTRRSAQLSLKVNGHHLVALVSSPNEVKASKWTTRGWTYQEGLLAQRRLIFTDKQAYFQCNASYSFEGWRGASRAKGRRADKFQVFSDSGAASTFTLGRRIQEYWRKNLSYQTDALAAFLGIMNTFSNNDEKFVHLHGLPLLPLDGSYELPETQHEALPYIAQSLLWQSCAFSLRRNSCPSWSWVGWHLIADHDDWSIYNPWYDIKLEAKVLVDISIVGETQDGQILHISAKESYGALRSFVNKVHPPRKLLLTGWCFDVTVPWSGGRRALLSPWLDSLGSPHGIRFQSPFPVSEWFDVGQRQVACASDRLVGILLRHGQHGVREGFHNYACLLLEQVDDHLYERVGTVRFNFEASDYFTEGYNESLHPGIAKRTVHVV